MHNFDEYIRQGEPDKKEKGIITRLGSDKTGHWQIN
jgi:hypothetical protein